MSHASFEVAAAEVKPANLRTGQFPTKQMEESMEDTMTVEDLTDSLQSMIRFNQVVPSQTCRDIGLH